MRYTSLNILILLPLYIREGTSIGVPFSLCPLFHIFQSYELIVKKNPQKLVYAMYTAQPYREQRCFSFLTPISYKNVVRLYLRDMICYMHNDSKCMQQVLIGITFTRFTKKRQQIANILYG